MSFYDQYDLIKDIFDTLEWVAILVGAFLIMEAINSGGDDPDSYT